jgi:nitrate reductase cytochrome c-type subunit
VILSLLPYPRQLCRSFITPPITRKRKAAEVDNDQPSPKAATKAHGPRHATSSDRPALSKHSSAATEITENTERASPASSASQKKRDLATPATTTASMDSDDDFMSDVSSQEDFGMQGSDNDSLGEGLHLPLDSCSGRGE